MQFSQKNKILFIIISILLYEFKLFLYKFGSFGLCRFKYTIMWDQMLTKGMFMHRDE
jgi:hypothetical protein